MSRLSFSVSSAFTLYDHSAEATDLGIGLSFLMLALYLKNTSRVFAHTEYSKVS